MNRAQVRKPWTVTDADGTAMLDALDRGAIGGDAGLDTENRVSYRASQIQLTVYHRAGGSAAFSVFSRNLGPRGMSLLHAGFVHEQTRVEVTLPTLWTSSDTVAAKVARCRHVGGLIHELELVFTEAIDLTRFVENCSALTKLLTQEMEKTAIRGSILLLNDQSIENDLIKFHLRETSFEVDAVTSPGEAIDRFKTNHYDLVLCDLTLGDQKGETVIAQFRALGYKGPILGLTGETNPARLSAATEAGASAIIEQPIGGEQLVKTLVEWMVRCAASAERGTEPIYSSISATREGEELARNFLDYVARLMNSLQRAIGAEDLSEVRGICLDIKECGGTAGFGKLSELAVEAIKALDSSCSIVESGGQLAALRAGAACLRAEPAPAAPATAH